MAFKVLELVASFKADTTSATAGLNSVDKQGKTTASNATKYGKLIKTAYATVAAAGVVAFTKAVVSSALEAEDAYQVQEEAIDSLNAALMATGQFSEETSQEIQDFATEMQGLTTVGDEASIALAQVAINAGLTADEAQVATKDAIALSEAFGVDLQAAIKATTNAQQGNYDMLNRYIPAVKNAEGETEKAAAAQEALAAAFEVAQAKAETSVGVETQLQNAIGDSKELVGAYVSEVLTPWRSKLLEIVTDLNNAWSAQKNLNDIIKTGGEAATNIDDLRSALEELTSRVEENAAFGMGLGDAWDYATKKQLEQRDAILVAIDAMESLNRVNNENLRYQALEEEYRKKALEEEKEAEEQRTEMAANRLERMLEFADTQRELYIEHLRQEEEKKQATIDSFDGMMNMYSFAMEKYREYMDFQRDAEAAQELLYQQRYDAFMSMTNGIMALTALGAQSSAQAAGAYKVIAAAQAGINSYLAFTKTLTDGGPFPLNTINAAGILASGIAQQVKIQTTSVPSFETGGIVPGTSYTGDNVRANVNSGEMILNSSQQARLFDMANNGGGGNITIPIYIAGKKVATEVVDAINTGSGGTISKRVIK